LGNGNGFLTSISFTFLKSVRNCKVPFFFGCINDGEAHSDVGCHSSTPNSTSRLTSFFIVSLWTLGIGKALLCLANYVADMSPTRVDVTKSWPTLRVVATQKRDTNAQFISITADKYKSAQTYGYISYNTFFVFELKGVADMQRHVGKSRHCCFGHPADTTFSCVCDMTSDVSRHVANTTQNIAVWARTKTTHRHLT